MISIGRNIAALSAQRSLDRATDAVARTSERLSSGLRINRASDDAAGIAVADALKNRANLFEIAGRNINDGVSAINIASSALDSQMTILQRLSELAEQAATGTYGATQRASADKEYQALLKEFGRLGDATAFNGVNLLRAGRGTTPSTLQIHTGATGQTSSILSIDGANSATLSGTVYAGSISGSGLVSIGGLQYSLEGLASTTQGQYFSTQLTDSSGRSRDIFLSVSFYGSSYGLRTFVRNSDMGQDGYFEPDSGVTIAGQSNFFELFPQAITGSSVTISAVFAEGTTSGSLTIDLSGLTFARSATAAPGSSLVGDVSGSTAIEFSNVATVTGAKAALTLLDGRRAELSSIQGKFGAAQSRLMSSYSGVESSRINTLAAESRIRDADIADETARLTLARIRQQTASAVLRQAVVQPEIALQLLRT